MHGHRDSAAEAPFALALAAGLFREPDGERFRALLSERGNANIRPSYLELTIVLSSRGVSNVAAIVDAVLAGLRIEIPPLTPSQARIAHEAYQGFGRGSEHPAKPNFGDCITYALANDLDEPLLFKGDDFSHKDLLPAIWPRFDFLRWAPAR